MSGDNIIQMYSITGGAGVGAWLIRRRPTAPLPSAFRAVPARWLCSSRIVRVWFSLIYGDWIASSRKLCVNDQLFHSNCIRLIALCTCSLVGHDYCHHRFSHLVPGLEVLRASPQQLSSTRLLPGCWLTVALFCSLNHFQRITSAEPDCSATRAQIDLVDFLVN